MKEDKPTMKNMLNLLETAKKHKKRIMAGAGAAIMAGSIGYEASKLANSDIQMKMPIDPKSKVESVDPDYQLPEYTVPGKIDSTEQIVIGREIVKDTAGQDGQKFTREDHSIIEEEKAHVHEYGEWQFGDEDKEVRTCSCGITETRSHKLDDPVVTYEMLEDGTHKAITTISCSTCGYTSTKEETLDCTYVIESADDELEYKTCSECGSKIEVAHDFNLGVENKDGVITYACKHEDCSYELNLIAEDKEKPEHVHEYGKAVITYEDINAKNHTVVTTQECLDPDCKEPLKVTKKMVPHTFGKGVVKDGFITYTCTSCGYEDTKSYAQRPSSGGGTSSSSHDHSYGEATVTYKDITNEGHTVVSTKKCDSCGAIDVTEAKVAHEFGVGVLSSDGTKITYTCKCGYQKEEVKIPEKHVHNYGEEVITYKDITDEGHIAISTKTCSNAGCDEPSIVTETYQEHAFDDGVLNDSETKITYTCSCGYQKEEDYEHIHSEVPSDLEYTFDSTNNDGTHKLKATYTCTKCNEEVTVYKNEDCEYSTTYESVGITNPNNIHTVINTCDICDYETRSSESCTKVGEMKYIKIYSNIYQYYDCEKCHGYVDRDYHTEHIFGEWEIDEKYHKRYCGCVEGREIGEHTFLNGVCTACGYTLDHEHAPNNMDLMDLVLSPYYDQLVSKSNFTNPNPNPDEYCYRYDLICSTCGVHYSIYYDHHYNNGICKRNGCQIQDPNYVPANYFEESNEIQNEITNENVIIPEVVLENEEIIEPENTSNLEETEQNVLRLQRRLGNSNY